MRRDKGIRTTIPSKDRIGAGDLLNRDFTAPQPDHTWAMDFTYCRTWVGWVHVAFIVDVYSQRIVGWHAQTTKHVDLVMIPLRMGLWERGRQGHPILPQQFRAHSDAGSQGGFNWSSQHLNLEVSYGSSLSSAGSGSGGAAADEVSWNGLDSPRSCAVVLD